VKKAPRPEFTLPNRPQLADFDRLKEQEFSQVERNPDYSDLSDENLVLLLVATESPARELVCVLIDQPARDAAEIYKQAVAVVRAPVPEALRMLHQHGATVDQLRSIIRTRIKLNAIYAELRKRFDRLPVGAALYRAVVGRPKGRDALLRSLRVERIKSFRQAKESDQDLRSEAVEAAWQKFSVMYESAAENVGLPRQVTISSGGEGPRFDWKQLRKSEVNASLALFLPLLRGDAERLPEKVHQRLRDHFEKWNAAKRAGMEFSLFDEEGSPASEPEIEELIAPREMAASLLKVAEDRWGERGGAFVQALSEGAKVAEAAKVAGVSRTTANKYTRELRRYARDQGLTRD